MRNILKFLPIFIFLASLSAQEATPSLINYIPNTNFLALKVKNAKEVRTNLDTNPLKSILYDDKVKEFVDEVFVLFDKEDTDVQIKDVEKKIFDKLFSSFNSEVFMTISFVKKEENKYDPQPKLIFSFIANVDKAPFTAFTKAGMKYADLALSQKTVSTYQHENVDYYGLKCEYEFSNNAFVAFINGIGVYSNDEDTCLKMISAVSKKTAIENGLKSNEKINAFFNANTNKDILVTADASPFFKNELLDEKSLLKLALVKAMKLDKLCQINATLDFDEKYDSFDAEINLANDGLPAFLPISNREFTSSSFINSEISTYRRAFFSVPELKVKLLEFANTVDPKFSESTYKSFLEIFNIDEFGNSISGDFEGFSYINKENIPEEICLSKLTNSSQFKTNLLKVFNSSFFKLLCKEASIAEKKENENQYWVFSFPTRDPNTKEERFVIGASDTYAFISSPGNMANKHLALLKSNADSKLSSFDPFLISRALYPSKLSLFQYAKTRDLLTIMKFKVKDNKDKIIMDHPKCEKLLLLLEEIIAEEFKGNLSFGLWKDSNKIFVSTKLTNK